jgi:hypothetical protein
VGQLDGNLGRMLANALIEMGASGSAVESCSIPGATVADADGEKVTVIAWFPEGTSQV